MKKQFKTSSSGRGKRQSVHCEYSFNLVCRCPVNPKTVDSYAVKVTVRRMIQVEHLLEVANQYQDRVIFQERLTQELAKRLRATVETTGRHSGVATRVVA